MPSGTLIKTLRVILIFIREEYVCGFHNHSKLYWDFLNNNFKFWMTYTIYFLSCPSLLFIAEPPFKIISRLADVQQIIVIEQADDTIQ